METENNRQDKNSAEELALYEKLRQQVSKALNDLQGKINTETISQAMDKAIDDLSKMGEHSRETIVKTGETLKKDIASTVEQIKPKIDEVADDTRKQFDNWHRKGGALWRDLANDAEYYKELSRDKCGAFLVNITRGLRDWSQKLKTSLTYTSGEITHGGEFKCMSCNALVHLKKPGRIPPCPKCANAKFQRS